MNYHILEIYTLKSMSYDIGKKIRSTIKELITLKEQKEIIDLIIIHRDEKKNKNTVNNDTLIDPL